VDEVQVAVPDMQGDAATSVAVAQSVQYNCKLVVDLGIRADKYSKRTVQYSTVQYSALSMLSSTFPLLDLQTSISSIISRGYIRTLTGDRSPMLAPLHAQWWILSAQVGKRGGECVRPCACFRQVTAQSRA
jgi:hypothetical protein